MKFLFASTPKISIPDFLIVSPAKYVGRVSKQAQTKLMLLFLKKKKKSRDNKDQQTGLRVRDTQRVAWSNYNSISDRRNTNDNFF